MTEIVDALRNLIALARPYMQDDAQVLGLREAEAALQAARPTSEPPAPPPWMVEVAREVGARKNEADGLIGFARSVRAGDQDRCDEVTMIIAALRLALERGHVVEPREWTEEELLKAGREDVAQVWEEDGCYHRARQDRAGECDGALRIRAALQARRNMLREGAVAAPTKAPARDRDGNPPSYAPGDRVQKVTGDYQINGIVRGVILTGAGLWRYAVEHQAEGGRAFLHIYAATNLSSTLPTREA